MRGKKISKIQQKGFSIIEVMLAFAIIVIAYVGVVQIFPYGLSTSKTSASVSQASFLAQAKLEELVGAGYENAPVGLIEPKVRLSADTHDPLYYFWRETNVFFVDENLLETAADVGLKKINTKVFYLDSITKKEKIFEVNALITVY